MAGLPYDVVYRISEEVAARAPDGPRDPFPFNHPSLCLSSEPHAQADLRACALVCRAWSIPASTVNVRHLVLQRVTPETIADALSRDDRDLLVQSLQLGPKCCIECTFGDIPDITKPCTHGLSMAMLLTVLSMCTNVRNVAVNEWLDLQLSPTVDYSVYAPGFSSITTFSVGSSLRSARTLDLRSFCQLLRLLPSLKRLTFGDISRTTEFIADIPPPDFALESLAVSDARSIYFQSYEWLLAHSAHSLRVFWVYGVFGEQPWASIAASLKTIAPSLNTLYYYLGFFAGLDGGVFRSCVQLEELCIGDLTSTVSSAIYTLPSLRKLVLAATSTTILHGEELEYLRFFSSFELRRLVDMLVRPREETFPKLEVLAIETAMSAVPMRDPPYVELKALRAACEARGVVFQFSRMKEVEDYYVDVRPLD
ncbi:hypothetical protein EXIGLDRAFT_724958 [Exidia glandulosa HHB12029]|uniref:F-box domain-containing protein n=1 Tax=Exidia glandulosa HHB12029 TaxID=1314781 RepID=A0A165MMC9_EXIGL|nr:hypothetical protein EXIGLDRAFT_724958 [Exidia glandulosa HHB12029]